MLGLKTECDLNVGVYLSLSKDTPEGLPLPPQRKHTNQLRATHTPSPHHVSLHTALRCLFEFSQIKKGICNSEHLSNLKPQTCFLNNRCSFFWLTTFRKDCQQWILLFILLGPHSDWSLGHVASVCLFNPRPPQDMARITCTHHTA